MYHATQQPQQYNNTISTTTGYFSTTATGYSSASDTDTSYDDHHHTSTSHFISHHQYLPSSSQYASDSEHSEHSSRSFSSEDPNNYTSRSSPSLADDPSPTDSSNLTDFPAMFCRAKYDYTAQDASALSFVTGDIIEVLTQQPSGWWDGLLGEERGWFPSNYVIVISEEEAEREWEGREIMQAGDNQMQMQMTGGQGQSHRHTQSTSSVVDMGQALMGGSSSSSTDEWLANTIAESRSMGIDEDQGLGGPSRGRGRGGAESDFWMPQVASNGQIFYINTKTGEQSRDLPQEAEDDIDLSMTDDAPLALAQSSSSSRAGPGVLGYATSSGPYTDLDPSSGPYASGSSNSQFQSQPGFGLPRRTDTPEPWIRRLADDGLSYYYLNQVDGRVQWTRPESSTSRGSELPETPTTAVPLPLHGRARSDSVNNLTGGGHGVYSDSSDVDVSLADEVDDAKGKGKQRSRGHAHSGSITTIGTTGTTETAIASGSGHSHLTTSSGGTFTGTLANSNVHNLPLSSTHSHNFSQGPDPSHKQLTPDSSFLQRQPTLSSESSDSQQALLLAAQLQSALYPPPPEDPLDMVHRARDAVERVIVRLNLGGLGILGETSPNQETSTGSMGGGREENASAMADLDTLIEDVVASVRGLLYVCGAGPSTTGGSVGGSRENGVIAAGGGGLEALIPKIMVGITPTVAFTSISASAASPSESSPLRIHTRTDSRSQSNPLKPSQRKLTATLSRLVLSARAIRYDSANASPESTIERIRGDAMELGRAIGAFGVEVQKVLDKLDRLNEDESYQRQISLNLTSNIDFAPMLLKLNLNSTLLSLGKKRLTAAFEPTNLGLGMPGSGRAGSWTGFGFVAEEDLDEYEDQDIESEVAERKKVNGNSKKANGVGGSNATDTDLSDFSEFSERESEGEGSEVSEFSEVDSGVDIEFGDSSNSDASSVVVRRSRPRRAPRGGRGKKRKRSPGHGSGVGVGSHSSNQAPEEVNLQSNQNNPKSSHPTKSGNHSSSHLAKKKNMPTRPPMKPLSPDLVSDIAASVTRLDAFLGVLDIAVVQQQQHSPAERNNTNATDQQYEYIQRAQRIHQVQRFAKDVIGQVQTVLELVDDVDVAESVVLDTPIPHDTTLSQSVDGPLNSLAEEKKKVVISNSNGEGSKDEREGGRTALPSHHSSHSLSTVETTETVDTVDTRMSSVFTHGTGSSFNGFSSSSHTSHTSHSQNSTPILDDNSHSSFISKHSPSFARTQDVSFPPRTDLSQTLPTARALLRMLEAGVQALYDDAAALWGHVQVLRVEGSDYPYSHSSSSSSNINSSSEFLSSSSYHSSDGSFSNQTDPAMILSVVNVLSTAIKANAAVVLQILDKLLALGVEQRTIVEGVLEEEDSATSSVGVAGGDMMNTRGTNGVRRWEESVRWSKRVSRDVDRDVSKRMSHQRSSMVRVRPASILPASVGPGAQGGGGYGGGVPTALQPGYNMLRYGGYEGQTHEVYDEYGRGSSSLPVSQMVGGGVTAPGIVGSDGDDELGLEDAFLRPQRPIRLEPIRFQGPQSPDAYGVPASQIIQSGQGKLQASGSSASLSQLGQSTDYPSYSGQFGMGQQGIPPMPGSILRNASAPMVTTLTSLNQPQYQNQAQYNQAQYQTQYQNQAQVQYNQIPKVRTMGSVGAQNVQGFSERNQYGQYPSDFEPGYGAIGSSANASEGEDTLSGGFDDFDEDDEDEDEDVLVRGSDDPLTPKIKGSGPPTPAKPNKISNKISSKAAKILGEEAPPWFLLPDEGKGPQETGLVVDPEDKSVKGGSVKALVERLTAHDTTDPNYSKAFLMTFKSFTTLNDLFDLLVERFRIQPPSGLATLQLRQWTSRKRNIVQFRVINTFKSMLTDEDILEKDDLYILARMKEFVLSEDVAQVSASRSLLALIERVQKSGETKRIVVKAAQTAPAPLLPKGFSSISSNLSSMANMGSSSAAKRLKLTDIEPLELARQLTLLESALYQKIRPMECLQRAREGVGAKDKDGGSGGGMDNIAYVIQTSNRIADWVAESVLSKEDSRKRAATVKHLILVADRCRTLNNFSTMIAIVSGLNTPPIRRLKRTWELVSQRHMAQFGACEVTLDSNRNFNKYRSMLASVVPPCVPFIGVFLSTLQFIQDGNKDLLSDGVVNFKKRQMASEVISDIKRWQAHTYNLQVVPAIRDYIEECLSAYDETDTRMSSDRFWQMSLEREPREREDEKMARLLQESGFL